MSNMPRHVPDGSSETSRALRLCAECLPRVALLFVAICMVTLGCRPKANVPATSTTADTTSTQPLRLLVIDDEPMARAIERQWTAHGEKPLQVRQISQDEFVKQQQKRLAADVVIYPSSLIGELASRDWLQPLAEQHASNTEFQWRDVWELPRLQEVKWGATTLAVPLGSPTLMLCYRPDIFDRLQLTVPKTWSDYQAIVSGLAPYDKFKELVHTPENEWRASCEPVGNGWAAELLLARAAAYARHPSQFSTLFDYRDLKPLVDGPPFVRALKELVAAQPPSGQSEADWQPLRKSQDAEGVRKMFVEGKCAVAITWPSLLPSELKGVDFPIAFAPLPGSVDVYNFRTAAWEKRTGNDNVSVPLLGVSGRLASVTKECRNESTAASLLFFVAGPELSSQISSVSKQTTLFRESHLTQANRWLGGQYSQEATQRYADAAKQTFDQSTCLLTLRIPGRHRYMAALDEAVWSSITGKSAPQEALRSAAQQWDSITNEAGRDAQRRAYMLSIGLEP
jgi:ABC-type glycerol-3-phosphate transport system substrate-binding protein